MTTSVFIRNDSPAGSGNDVFVGVKYQGDAPVNASTPAPLKPGESVTTTVYAGVELVVRETEFGG